MEVGVQEAKTHLSRLLDQVEALQRRALTSLPVEHAHAAAVEQLPTHHRDPFDRLLVAQATVEGAVLATADDQLDRYAVPQLRP